VKLQGIKSSTNRKEGCQGASAWNYLLPS